MRHVEAFQQLDVLFAKALASMMPLLVLNVPMRGPSCGLAEGGLERYFFSVRRSRPDQEGHAEGVRPF